MPEEEKPKEEAKTQEPAKPDASAVPSITIPDPVTPPAAETPAIATQPPADKSETLAKSASEALLQSDPQPEKPAATEAMFGPAVETGGGGKKKIIITILIIFVLLLIGLGGLFFFGNRGSSEQKEESKEESSEVSPTPADDKTSASPSAAKNDEKLNLKEYDIRVLNGSGVSGEAAKVQGILDKAGFTVVSVGNADKSDYEETTLQVKKDVKDAYIKELLKVLEESYTVDPKTASISGSTTADLVVIIGSKKAL